MDMRLAITCSERRHDRHTIPYRRSREYDSLQGDQCSCRIRRRITDLFVSSASELSADQVDIFDDVMTRLIDEVEQSACTDLGQRLSALTDAPPRAVRKLALDESIQVAGPLLSKYSQLDEETLVFGAQNKSQDHLLAISMRELISEAVTDVLVDRGNRKVVINTAENRGARFSDQGYSTLARAGRA